jgi:hypothetical protein
LRGYLRIQICCLGLQKCVLGQSGFLLQGIINVLVVVVVAFVVVAFVVVAFVVLRPYKVVGKMTNKITNRKCMVEKVLSNQRIYTANKIATSVRLITNVFH